MKLKLVRRLIAANLLKSGTLGVTPPPGFTWTFPFKVVPDNGTFSVGGWDVSSLAPTGKTYYVKTDGNDADTGENEAHALQKVSTAVMKSDANVVRIKAGTYTFGYGWEGQSPANRDLSVIGYGGDVILSCHIAGLTWSAVNNHYEATYATNVRKVYDKKTPDINGDYSLLTQRTSAALVDANPGSYWYSGGKLYVRTSDSRVPDSDIIPFVNSNGIDFRTPKTLYLENITYYGASSCIVASVSSAGAKLYAKNCVTKYAYTLAGFSIFGLDEIILQNCVAARHTSDGFSIGENTNRYANIALIDCVSRHNGVDSGDNGFSRNNRGQTTIINGEFYNNIGSNIYVYESTVTGDPLLWCLGTYAHDSAGAGAEDVDFAVGQASPAGGIAYLDTCRTGGSALDFLAATGSTINFHNHTPIVPTVSGAGTFIEY